MPFATKISPFQAPDYDVFSPARRSDPRGVILGAPLDGAKAYVPWIGLSTVRELALKYSSVGLVPVEDLDAAHEFLENERALLRQANKRIEELEAQQERIAGLALDGFRVQKIMGRPKKEVAA